MNRQDMVEAGARAIVETLGTRQWNAISDLAKNIDRSYARAVLDAVLPQITDASQMLGVPEGSILYVERDSETFFYTWRGEKLHNLGGAGGFIPEYILQWGALTLAWRP